MARVCMRPGCDRPADARLSYDTISCQVWLDQMPERLGPVQEICQFHAARLTVPRGWTLNDRRVDVALDPEFDLALPGAAEPLVPEPVVLEPVVLEPVVLEPVARVVATATPRRSNRRRHPSSSARQLFEDELVPAAAPAVQPDPDPALDPDLELDLDLVIEVALDLDLESDPDPATNGTAASTDPMPDPQLEASEVPEHAEVMAAISVDVDDDLPESLRATSPLLARAFRATGPQRSVLSEELAQPSRHADD